MNRKIRAAFISVIVLLYSGTALYGENASVPDIETRIRNSGNEVPSSALPVFRLPPPVELPAEQSPPVPVAEPEEDASPVAVTEPVSAPDADKPAVTGHASVGSGYPATLAGEFAVYQPEGRSPGFSAEFGYSSSDGYGGKDLGRGFFDRSVGLSLKAFRETGPKNWYAAISIGDRANGLQENHPAYFSIGHRLAGFNAGADLFSLGENGPLLSVYLDSQVFTASAERGATDPLPGTGIDDYRGYYLSPGVRLSFTPALFRVYIDATYALDTVADLDDLHALKASLSAYRTFGSLDVGAGAAFHTDSSQDFVVPFFARIDWNREEGIFRNVSLSGGLQSDRHTVFELAREDPFVQLDGMPVYTADWFASFNAELQPLTDIRLGSALEFKKTAGDRDSPVLTDIVGADGRVLWTVADRESLVVSAFIAYTGQQFSVKTGYRGELLDELWASHLHEIDVTLSVYDPAPRQFWAAEASAVLMPDSGDLPRIGLSGQLHPLPRLAITLTFDDILPPLFGENRMINSEYRERGGSVLLSARFDF